MKSLLRHIPAVDILSADEEVQRRAGDLDPRWIHQLAREAVGEVRERVLRGDRRLHDAAAVQAAAERLLLQKIDELLHPSLRPVINCTGIVLHTGLGRAVPPPAAIEAAASILHGYSNLEFDLDTGKRGDRTAHVERLLCLLTGAEAACVVNNNAAAVLIALNTLANRKQVLISRGELIEIGGSFRIPDVMAKSGAKMVEVGTTNKTHLRDFEAAISEKTAGVLHVHTSNYRILGFTAAPELSELIELAHARGLFVLHDLGGGILLDLRDFGLPYEPVVRESIELGTDVVTFSGDKVLGGPQSGIIVGRRQFIQRIKRNPLMRALRCDKVTYALLEATLRTFLHRKSLGENHPVLRMLSEPVERLRERGQRILQRLQATKLRASVELTESEAQAGSGTLPLEKLPSVALAIQPQRGTVTSLAKRLRLANPPVIGYVHNDLLFLDLRTVLPGEIDPLITILLQHLS